MSPQISQLRAELRSGLPVPIVEWSGLRVHAVVVIDVYGDAWTRCGDMVPKKDVPVLVRAARELSKSLPCRNCHRSERRNP